MLTKSITNCIISTSFLKRLGPLTQQRIAPVSKIIFILLPVLFLSLMLLFKLIGLVFYPTESKSLVPAVTRWELKTLSGKDFNFADTKDKVVFINIWATWCPPCRKELPSLQKLYDKTKDRVKFLFVSDEKVSEVADFLNKTSYSLPVFISPEDFPSLLSVDSYPTTFILARDGHIVLRQEGEMDWNTPDVIEFLEQLSR